MSYISIEQFSVIISHMADALKRNGYQVNMLTMKILKRKLQYQFSCNTLSKLPSDLYGDMIMYLDQWRTPAALRFEMRNHKLEV